VFRHRSVRAAQRGEPTASEEIRADAGARASAQRQRKRYPNRRHPSFGGKGRLKSSASYRADAQRRRSSSETRGPLGVAHDPGKEVKDLRRTARKTEGRLRG